MDDPQLQATSNMRDEDDAGEGLGPLGLGELVGFDPEGLCDCLECPCEVGLSSATSPRRMP